MRWIGMPALKPRQFVIAAKINIHSTADLIKIVSHNATAQFTQFGFVRSEAKIVFDKRNVRIWKSLCLGCFQGFNSFPISLLLIDFDCCASMAEVVVDRKQFLNESKRSR